MVVRWSIVVLLLGYAITQFPNYPVFPELTGAISAFILNTLGIFSIAKDNHLWVATLPQLNISAECSGVALAIIFPLIIFLLPYFPLRQRIASLFFVPILFLGNVLRIVIDVLVGIHFSTESLIFFHDGIGQVFIFAWAIGCYIIWLLIFKNFPKEKLFFRPRRAK